MRMNDTLAKILLLAEKLPPEERNLRFISSKMDKNYAQICREMSYLEDKEAIQTAKKFRKRVILNVTPSALEQAKAYLES